jgi:hypothetical protein
MNRKFPSDAPCPGIGEACWLARDRIVSMGMMGGGAFLPLKVRRLGLESTKQPEICLAGLWKILGIPPPGENVRGRRMRETAISTECG